MRSGTHYLARTSGSSLLIVEDDEPVRAAMAEFFENDGFEVQQASCLRAARSVQAHVDVVVSDYFLPDGNALELLHSLQASGRTAPLIVMTGQGTIELAVNSMKEGAEQFLVKPVDLPALKNLIAKVLEGQRNARKQKARTLERSRYRRDPFVGSSTAIRTLAQSARKLLASSSPILIQGETGTGKGVLAAWLHENSSRSEEAFVDVNCAGLTRDLLESELFGFRRGAFTGAISDKPGLFEVAHRGTIFLDEIGDLELAIQPKLLKVVEELRFRRLGDVQDRVVDTRLIAATHHDLAATVTDGRFREDLYFRLNTFTLQIPPLRERREDIPAIAAVVLAQLARDLGREKVTLSPEAIQKLVAYSWPGNIRELRNVLERAIMLADKSRIEPQDFGLEGVQAGRNPGNAVSASTPEGRERLYIQQVLEAEHGKVAAAAARLGMPRSTLYARIKEYQLHR